MSGEDYLDVELSITGAGTGWIDSAVLSRCGNGVITRVTTLEDATDKNATNVTIYLAMASTAPVATPAGVDTIWAKTFATSGLSPVVEDDTVLDPPRPYALRGGHSLYVGANANTATGTGDTTLTVRVWFRENR
jgi:hypothetical protein